MSKSIRRPHGLLHRILDTPHLAQVVPRLQPELLHRIILRCGLEDCGELLARTTPDQLTRLFDLDLWRTRQPGLDEQFDADRFGLWIETLVEAGADVAAGKLAEMDIDVVIAGLASHARVFDRGSVTPYETTDGVEVPANRTLEDRLTHDVGGYVLVARRAEESTAWDAIVSVLMALDAEHPDAFHHVMRGCRARSNSGGEVDGLDDLLAGGDQQMFDLAMGREHRREKQGYATPVQARAFLQMSRQFRADQDTTASANPVARAYFRAIDATGAAETFGNTPLRLSTGAAGSAEPPETESSEETVAAVVELLDMLQDAGVAAGQPRALLVGSQGDAARLGRLRAHMQFVFDRDPVAYATRSGELAYLANTLMAGCSIQGRALTEQESSEAAVAVCNLGLENWPSQSPLPDDFLQGHDLVSVFQAGWTVLHRDVGMYAAEQLVSVLTPLRCGDRETQMELTRLRVQMAKHWRAGEPWRARGALDAIASLDMPAWVTLVGLIDECPVLPAAIAASQDSRTRAVSASAFEFISENSQIVSVRAFMQALPDILRR